MSFQLLTTSYLGEVSSCKNILVRILGVLDLTVLQTGKPYRQHVANVKLHAMMEAELKHEESSVLKGKRQSTIEKLMEAIRNGGGRFLQQDNVGCWVELDEKVVQEKVGRAFRTRLRNASSELKQQNKL